MNAISIYRLANKLHKMKIPLIPKLLKNIIYLIFNSFIPYEAKIGNGTRFGYGGMGVVIHKKAIIGKNCIIGQQVTIGSKQAFFTKEILTDIPVIGDDVYIAGGAKILGSITIGDHVIIGANSVVLTNIPAYGIVAGIPAKIIKYREKNTSAIK